MTTKRTRKKLISILFVLSLILAIEISALMLIEVKNFLEKEEFEVPEIEMQENEETTEPTKSTEVVEEENMKPVFTTPKPSFGYIYLDPDYEENSPSKGDEIVHDQEFIDRCRLTFAESGGESMEGQIAVAATIINREESNRFPNNFYDVMNQKGQFSPVWNGEIHVPGRNGYVVLDYEKVPDKTIEAVERALKGEDPTEQLLWEEALRLGLDPEKYAEGGALYFYNPKGCSDKELAAREKIKVKVRIGNHIFYKVWG